MSRMDQRWESFTWDNIGGPAARGIDAAILYGDYRPFLSGVSETAFGLFVPTVAARTIDKIEPIIVNGSKLGKIIDRFAGATGKAEAKLADKLAKGFTRGEGDRVVLGKFPGYIREADTNGGKFYQTSAEFFDRLADIGGKDFAESKAWLVNETSLRQQMKAGVSRFDFTAEGIVYAGQKFDSFTAQEMRFLAANASNFGYVKQGSSWVRKIK